MKQEDKLRNTLREYYDTRQVPYNDNEWEQASAYLSAARRKRIIRRCAIILAVVLCPLFIVLLNSSKLTGNEKSGTSLVSNQQLKSASNSQALVLRAPTAESKTRINSNQDRVHKHSEHIANSTAETHANISKTGGSSLPDNALQAFEPKPIESELNFVQQKNPAEEVSLNDNNPQVAVAIPTNVAAPVSNAQDNVKREAPQDSKENEVKESIVTENFVPAQPQATAPVQIPQVADDPQPATAKIVALDNNKKEETPTDPVLPSETLAVIADTSPAAPIAATTSSLESMAQDTSRIASADRGPGEGIFYEAGAAWLYGWKGPVNRDARGFSPVVGINYMNRLAKRYAVSFGLGYLMVPNLSNSSKTSRVSSYTYGEQSRVTVITPSTMHYLIAPLRFHYYLNSWNNFGVGINLAYLLNVDATVKSYDEKPGFNGNYETVKQGGYTEGFSWFDSQMTFFYARKIGGSLALQGEIFLGLVDVKQDKFFRFNGKERNSGTKLSLIYYAFRKNGK